MGKFRRKIYLFSNKMRKILIIPFFLKMSIFCQNGKIMFPFDEKYSFEISSQNIPMIISSAVVWHIDVRQSSSSCISTCFSIKVVDCGRGLD